MAPLYIRGLIPRNWPRSFKYQTCWKNPTECKELIPFLSIFRLIYNTSWYCLELIATRIPMLPENKCIFAISYEHVLIIIFKPKLFFNMEFTYKTPAANLCKQFQPRSDTDLDSNCSTLIVFLKDLLLKW